MASTDSPARELTERQQFWLEHLRRALDGGTTLAAYAAAHDLSRASLYGHLKTFRARGIMPPTMRAKVRVARVVRTAGSTPNLGTASPACVCRVHLPNGCVVEWQGEPGEEQLTSWLRSASTLR